MTANHGPGPTYEFRLYVAGETRNSNEALRNLTRLCEAYLPGRHTIDVVDVFREPQRALAEGIFMTPTLLRVGPRSTLKIVGTLSDTATVMHALNLEGPAP